MSARVSKLERKSLVPDIAPLCGEAAFWAAADGVWQHLHGGVRERGYSIEWHDFTAGNEFDWTPSFHGGALEICLNLAGRGWVQSGAEQLALRPLSAGFYFQGKPSLSGRREAGERHQFITIELSPEFLRQYLDAEEECLHDAVRDILSGNDRSRVSQPIFLGSEHRLAVSSLRKPPVFASAQKLWYRAKALEIAASVFFRAPGEDLFCQRQQRLNRERVQKVIGVLRENLAGSLSLEEIGRRVGCSHFHLSRVFSQETGHSIFQHLRQMRLERAADLLREGRLNVTQVALEVGYSSPSHFSVAFHEAFGCCPGLFPLATPAQRPSRRKTMAG